MKGWRKPKAFAAAYSAQKRFLAFVLTLAMIFTSVGTDLNVSYAAQGNKVDFEIYGSDLVNAINEAVESDNVVKPDSLEFTNGAIDMSLKTRILQRIMQSPHLMELWKSQSQKHWLLLLL